MRKDFTAAVMEAAVGDKSPSEKHQIKKADNVMSLPAFLIWCPQGDLNLLRCQISLPKFAAQIFGLASPIGQPLPRRKSPLFNIAALQKGLGNSRFKSPFKKQ
jgi:hypothetical protein